MSLPMTVPDRVGALLPQGDLEAYLARVRAIPCLTEEEETQLALSYRLKGDLKAAQQLVLAHLRYVVKIANGYMGYGLGLSDLIQEGTIGLMKAVKRFEPQHGARLATFAIHWIKAEIHNFILKNWRIVKIATTKAQKKLFFNLRQMRKNLGWLSREEAQMVASDLGVSLQAVRTMEERLQARDLALEHHSDHEEEHTAAPIDYLEDKSGNPEERYWSEKSETRWMDGLHQAMEQLKPRDRDIIKSRWLNPEKATLQELALRYEVSPERVRQLEKKAFGQLLTHLQADKYATE